MKISVLEADVLPLVALLACSCGITSARRAGSTDQRAAGSPGSADALTTQIRASDFEGGTYRITRPGRYVLEEDVDFEPSGPGVTDMLHPEVDSKAYPQLEGWFMGFFAAITVEAADVELDCGGHEIRMSERFHRHQRFFSIIELGSKPFIAGQGPPQFANWATSPGEPTSASRVLIQNCVLGLSSHHGIHGNDNRGVTLQNLKIRDFEVGGVSLNGASQVVLKHLDVGPSLRRTFASELSSSIFVDHLASSLLPRDQALRELAATAMVTLRKSQKPVAEVFAQLRRDLREFLSAGTGPLQALAGDGRELPDGSAIYGVLLHRLGVAIQDFGTCPSLEQKESVMCHDVQIEDVHIHGLRIDTEQTTRMVIDGKQVMGPAGDVFTITKVWDPGESFQYVGNTLSDAQLAMGALVEHIRSQTSDVSNVRTISKYYFGNLHIPGEVLRWASGSFPDTKAIAWAKSLEAGSPSGKFECFGDALSHVQKGTVGLRLGFQRGVALKDIRISALANVGRQDARFCRAEGYKGGDVRAIALSHVEGLRESGVSVDEGSLLSAHGSVIMTAEKGTVGRLPWSEGGQGSGVTSFGGMLASDMMSTEARLF